MVLVKEVGGGENGFESWTEFELTTDTNGSEPSSGPEPKSEAASCTVLMLSSTRNFQDVAVPRSETKRESGNETSGCREWVEGEVCALARLLFTLPTTRVRKLLSESSGGGT